MHEMIESKDGQEEERHKHFVQKVEANTVYMGNNAFMNHLQRAANIAKW